ncbi:hypothetical protein AYL99_01296 [Fonsecaea erecta]|uniref:Metallo-beta-lactamase domain-containing protein n=1 Tax=Fonsecaea erecta TaxID=1367422 RepID=A0A178ZZM9_9EURO|nr:hypothetical protein AYL99_01296 [Fonsecaea erecta]OAP65324.1 hypothetical protein AYL99_01296 [Fonsecaea erecta]
MQSLRPHIGSCSQATRRLLLTPTTASPASTVVNSSRQSCLSSERKAAYSTQTSVDNGSLVQTTPRRPLSKRTPVCGPCNPRSSRALPWATKGRSSYSTEAAGSQQPVVHDVFETKTGTWQYVVADPATRTAAIIDPVLDYDPATQAVTTKSADALIALVKDKGYTVDLILETHAHADHLTASSYLQNRLAQEQGRIPIIGIGKRIGRVQQLFANRYGVPADEYEGVFDKLFEDDETFNIGELEATAMHLPDNVFCGDSIFHADIGTARCDFPGGSASDLFKSGRRLLSLPDHVKIWTGHDYPPAGRDAPVPWMTVAQHRQRNKHLKDGTTEEEFVAMRNERDAGLAAPRLIHQSLQVNIRAGRLPKPTDAGLRMLHLPLKPKTLEW